MKSLGQVAYERWVEIWNASAIGIVPSWDRLGPVGKESWEAAAQAVVKAATSRVLMPGNVKQSLKLLLAVLLCCPILAYSQPCSIDHPPILPDLTLSPGAMVTNVPLDKLTQRGYANVIGGGVRHTTQATKRRVFIKYFGRVPDNTSDFEIDHIVSLELGGADEEANLFPQSYKTFQWNAHTKDRLENRMAALVRWEYKTNGTEAATVLLHRLQSEILTNWTNAFGKYLK